MHTPVELAERDVQLYGSMSWTHMVEDLEFPYDSGTAPTKGLLG